MEREMDMGHRRGLIKLFILGNGKIINPMAKESLHILLAIIIKVSGSTLKLMAKANLLGLMEIPILDSGLGMSHLVRA